MFALAGILWWTAFMTCASLDTDILYAFKMLLATMIQTGVLASGYPWWGFIPVQIMLESYLTLLIVTGACCETDFRICSFLSLHQIRVRPVSIKRQALRLLRNWQMGIDAGEAFVDPWYAACVCALGLLGYWTGFTLPTFYGVATMQLLVAMFFAVQARCVGCYLRRFCYKEMGAPEAWSLWAGALVIITCVKWAWFPVTFDDVQAKQDLMSMVPHWALLGLQQVAFLALLAAHTWTTQRLRYTRGQVLEYFRVSPDAINSNKSAHPTLDQVLADAVDYHDSDSESSDSSDSDSSDLESDSSDSSDSTAGLACARSVHESRQAETTAPPKPVVVTPRVVRVIRAAREDRVSRRPRGPRVPDPS